MKLKDIIAAMEELGYKYQRVDSWTDITHCFHYKQGGVSITQDQWGLIREIYQNGQCAFNGMGSNFRNIHIDKTNRKFIYKTKQEHIELDI
jgi:aspartate oxidase